MNPAKVLSIVNEELGALTHTKHVLNTLKTKTIYRIKLEYNIGWWNKPDMKHIELIAKVKSFNKQSVRLQVFAASLMESLKGDLADMHKKLILKDHPAQEYWALTSAERKELLKDIEIPNLETTFDYGCFTDWSEFEPIEVPLVVSYEYISPKFKRDYFKA